jgi:hypothetical protein
METIRAKEILDVRADLLRKGFTLSTFASRHGLRPGTVVAVIHRHCGKSTTQKTIYGPVTRRILQLLDEDIHGDH